MSFSIERSIEILERTPLVLKQLLSGLPEHWTGVNEGPETWSPYDVIGHLIHGETTDWTKRMDIILSDGGNKEFATFDRFAQFQESKGKSLEQLLNTFHDERKSNITYLLSKNISKTDLQKTGIHPKFGKVTLQQLLSTWVAHDLDHIMQISRVMAKQYREDVGPWKEYLKIMQ
ncbi:MAG TPA: DinB family protein [Chitinophagales bacterium]|nr:DinB family protein [Chitinophagales bacterium]HMX03257.1 DinB family protein [Chitinophagales bacterium]HMZ88061.1 DinB family protein [Chitinophagales bacterium]HNE46064.1 DinB family protein [Chitinophagales bacterium]HNF68335.1 DinB family protein [Chitinophagales bacterium]